MAAELLIEKGYEILVRNYRTKLGEIDIVARKDGVTVFVEVKTKVGDDFGTPEEMVDRRKIKQVKRMAMIYLSGQEVVCRLDVVAIVLGVDGGVVRLTHWENVE